MKKIINIIKTIVLIIGIYFLTILLTYLIIYLITFIFNKTSINSISAFRSSSYKEVADIIGKIIFILTLNKYYKNNLFKKCKFKPISLNKVFYIIIFSIGFSLSINSIYILLDKFFQSYESLQLKIIPLTFLAIIINDILMPIIEEIIFRGLIFNSLKRKLNIILAVIIQALIFGIAHGNLFQGTSAFIGGIFLALIYLYADSLYGSIIFHMIFNFSCDIIDQLKYINLNLIALLAIVCLGYATIKIIENKKYLKDLINF